MFSSAKTGDKTMLLAVTFAGSIVASMTFAKSACERGDAGDKPFPGKTFKWLQTEQSLPRC
jgi:hypothetical protein